MKTTGAAHIAIQVDDKGWRGVRGASAAIRAAATLALGRGRRSVTILLTSDARMKALNWQFRGQNKSTNVLSFPSPDRGYLGDIAIGRGIVAREAKAQGKTFADHAAHLAVHGVLHLMGYDHENPKDAARMEIIERRMLHRLDIADPYADMPPNPEKGRLSRHRIRRKKL